MAAIPTTFVLPFAWFTFPAGTGSVILHQIDGSFVGCCSPATVPTWTSLSAGGAFLVGAASGLVVAGHIAGRGHVLNALVAVPVILALALGSGVSIAWTSTEPLSLTSVTDRRTETVGDSRSGIQVCV